MKATGEACQEIRGNKQHTRILKLIGKVLLGVLAFIFVGLGTLYWNDPAFGRRLMLAAFVDVVRDVEFYQPLEVVKGSPAAPLPRTTATSKTINPEAWAVALRYAQKMESLALVVWHRGAIQYEYYQPGFKPEERTDPASMHKSVIALVVGQAIADGFIKSVDDPVANYIPEWAVDDRKTITIRHLLQMASGLARPAFSFNLNSGALKLNLGSEIHELTLSTQAGYAPGTAFSYYNINPQMLGIVLERVTGKRYAQYLSESLWSKLGTRDAYVSLDHEAGLARTFCCLQASAEDWVRLGLLHLNRGKVGNVQVVAQDWVDQITTPSPLNPNYGFLTWLGTTYEAKQRYGKDARLQKVPHNEPFAAPGIIYFDGRGGQRVYVIPSEEMVIVRTGAGGIDIRKNEFLWYDAILPNALIRGALPEAESAAAN